jgi:hypothetical protein
VKQIGKLNDSLTKKPYIHRIELLDRFFKMLDRKELVFVRPGIWSDPLENIAFNAVLMRKNKRFEHPMKSKIYAQCWSYEEDSYALWQIYTMKPNNRGEIKRHFGIRITTHLNRLVQLSSNRPGKFYFGLVNYLFKKELDQLPRNKDFVKGLASELLNENHLKTLLVKRKSYEYEKELRMLAVSQEARASRQKDQLLRIPFEPTKFISSLRLDPTMDEQTSVKVRHRLVNEYGFKKSQITQSTLSQSNKLIFRLREEDER